MKIFYIDLQSPYLFVICAEGLSPLLDQAERRQLLSGLKVCRAAPIVTHLFFVDVVWLFCKAKSS